MMCTEIIPATLVGCGDVSKRIIRLPFGSVGIIWFTLPVSSCFSLTCPCHFLILLVFSSSSLELFTLQALAISPIQWHSWNSTFNFRELLSRKGFSISSQVIFHCPPKAFIGVAHIHSTALLFIFAFSFTMQIHDVHGAQNSRYFFVIITLCDPFNF